MNFKSLDFVFAFPVVLAVVFLLPQRVRWAWLLLASMFFYSRWNPVYILLLVAHSFADYVFGILIYRAPTKARKRFFLLLSLMTGLGLLAYFKYAGFLVSSTYDLLAWLGHPKTPPKLDIVLPVGISFYTVQTLSYTIDMYRGQIRPEKHPGYFMLFVTYFPHMVAGPIMRSPTLLGELHKRTKWDTDRVLSGLRRMAWGFFKKLVVADRISMLVGDTFHYANTDYVNGSSLLIATYFVAFQIYADFSGYSDIAIGAARMMGHDLVENFERPYFSPTVSAFWRRWHISLQTWFRDYLFIPLTTNRMGPLRQALNVMIVFMISGLWHGANWTFVAWGLYNGVALVLDIGTRGARERLGRRLGLTRVPAVVRGFASGLLTFHVILASWVLFMADSLRDAVTVFRKIAHVTPKELAKEIDPSFVSGVVVIAILLAVEAWQGVKGKRVEDLLEGRGELTRVCVYAVLAVTILLLGNFGPTTFVYFQF